MRFKGIWLSVFVITFFIGGCFDAVDELTGDITGKETAGCDLRNKGRDSRPRCQERISIPTSIELYKQTCGAGGLVGTVVDGPCPRDGIIGGCRLGEGANDTVDYYYSSDSEGTSPYQTVDDVKAKCMQEDQPFVPVS